MFFKHFLWFFYTVFKVFARINVVLIIHISLFGILMVCINILIITVIDHLVEEVGVDSPSGGQIAHKWS